MERRQRMRSDTARFATSRVRGVTETCADPGGSVAISHTMLSTI